MTQERNGILIKYTTVIRDLVNMRTRYGMIKLKDKETYRQGIKRLFRFNNEIDWDFLLASMDLVEDTALAIDNFQEFKVEGPTKYDNDGEKYIRLYGLLNAVYLQQSAVIKIYEIFRINNISQLKKQVNQLKILDLRHKLAAHSVNYKDHGKDEIDAFALSRITMSGFNLTFQSYINNKFEDVDLNKLLGEYIEVTITTLDQILDKAIKTICSTSKEKKDAWGKKLDLLRHQKAGDIVIASEDSTIIFKTVTSSDTD